MATAPSANDLTRQQLDELDALLQRMLSLPLNPPDLGATPPPAALPVPVAAPREAAPASLPFATPWRIDPPPPGVPVPTRPVVESIPIPVPAPKPVPPPAPTPVLTVAPVPVPAPPRPVPPAPKPAPPPAPQNPPVVAAPTPTPAEPAQAIPAPPLLVPFVMFNQGLNSALGLLGVPGRILRSGFVKTLFGLTGLGLIAYTGLKVAQIHGWMSLPVTLPWPR